MKGPRAWAVDEQGCSAEFYRGHCMPNTGEAETRGSTADLNIILISIVSLQASRRRTEKPQNHENKQNIPVYWNFTTKSVLHPF